MDRCTVCGSFNLNQFLTGKADPAFWCEDCGSMHVSRGGEWSTACPEKSMLHHQVTAFHKKFGQPIAARPHVPSEAMVRFRLKLITEEFFELLEAALDDPTARLDLLHGHVRELINDDALDVNLPEFIDALGDMDYISEGTRLVFGVDGRPIADEIQRANMAKVPSPIVCIDCDPPSVADEFLVPNPDNSLSCSKCGNGGLMYLGVRDRSQIKPAKPPGWTPPDIDRVLIEQGWKP